MAVNQESFRTANKLSNKARQLLSDSDHKTVKFGTTTIKFNKIGLDNGNLTSIIGSMEASGNLYKNSTWNLKSPPIDPPDIVEMNRLAEILAIFL